MADATDVLLKHRELQSPYSIKPDRSPEERKKEKCLMSVRWSLIQSGIERKNRKSSLLVNNVILGKVDSSNTFQYADSDTVSVQASVDESTPYQPNALLSVPSNTLSFPHPHRNPRQYGNGLT